MTYEYYTAVRWPDDTVEGFVGISLASQHGAIANAHYKVRTATASRGCPPPRWLGPRDITPEESAQIAEDQKISARSRTV